ncbi:MAG: hypothetical protein AAFQ68_20325 [Bacteroidota bacterium]
MKYYLYILSLALFALPNLGFGQSNQTEWETYLSQQWIVQPFGQAAGMDASQCSSGKMIQLQAGGKTLTEACQNGLRRQSQGRWQITSSQEGIWSLQLDGISYQIEQEEIDSRIRLILIDDSGQKLVIYRLIEMKDVPVPEGEETH